MIKLCQCCAMKRKYGYKLILQSMINASNINSKYYHKKSGSKGKTMKNYDKKSPFRSTKSDFKFANELEEYNGHFTDWEKRIIQERQEGTDSVNSNGMYDTKKSWLNNRNGKTSISQNYVSSENDSQTDFGPDLILAEKSWDSIQGKPTFDRKSFDNFGLEGKSKFSRYRKSNIRLPHIKGEIVFGIYSSILAIQNRNDVYAVYMKKLQSHSNNNALETVVNESKKRDVEIRLVSKEILDELAQGRQHQGVCVDVCKKQAISIQSAEELSWSKTKLSLYLDAIQDPMNFGAILRSAYYMGVEHVIVPSQSSSSLSPVVSKASAGALEMLSVYSVAQTCQFLEGCKKLGWHIIGTVGRNERAKDVMAIEDVDHINQKVLVIIGNEGAGISSEIKSLCDTLITIQGAEIQHPFVDSLNVSVASGIILHHMKRTICTEIDSIDKNSKNAIYLSSIDCINHVPLDGIVTKESPLPNPEKNAMPRQASDIMSSCNMEEVQLETKMDFHTETKTEKCIPLRSGYDNHISTEDNIEYIKNITEISKEHLTPELSLYLITPKCSLWSGQESDCILPDPYWAFYWPGGQAVTRYILDNPSTVHNKNVLDIGSGCGATSIAAKMCGAQRVCANDISYVASIVLKMNSEINKCGEIESATENLIGKSLDEWDIIILGDMFYDQEFTDMISTWILELKENGKIVFIGDPGRMYFLHHPIKSHLTELAKYKLTLQSMDENNGLTHASVWTFKD